MLELCVNPSHPQASDRNSGTPESPFRSISSALAAAHPGSTVRVWPGVYRETVTPVRGGEEGRPITLRADVFGTVVVRGSERLCGPLPPGVHELNLPADVVGTDNPFAVALAGSRIGGTCGQVFLGEMMLREVGTREVVQQCPGTWCAAEGGSKLVVHIPASAAPADLEVSVRDRLFAPAERGMGHLVIEGFVFERCANQSAASFWEAHRTQRGAVGFRAGHHIRFAHNVVRFAKTIGMDIGVQGGGEGADDGIVPHDNVVEDNLICDNGEVGACGRLSRRTIVRRNRIERNAYLSLHTVEEAGLKFHQFYDGLIEQNLILNNDAAGIWLDAVWPGARVTRNLVLNSMGSGIFMELGADSGTVDHNIVAYTRLGDGIYCHDASDLTIAHNLVFGNAHFGIYMRYVTDRPFEHRDGEFRPAECSRNRIANNLLIDNYRGHICLPANSERSGNNGSFHNHFVNGTQWQWEGTGFHKFCLGDNDGDVPREQVHRQLADAGLEPGPDPMNAYLTLEQWRALGFDNDSTAPNAFRITSENGAVVKGTATLGADDPYLQLRFGEDGMPPTVPTLPGFETDYFGNPRGERSMPGPFASIDLGLFVIDISPRTRT
jgi:hypothetical protein